MTPEIITFDELSDKLETLTNDEKLRVCGELLITALNDWPATNLNEPKDLIAELENEIRKPLTFDNLKLYSDGLNVAISGNAWKKESMTSLLEMFESAKNSKEEITLDVIIKALTNDLRAEK
jgi:hypothetical protein